MAPCALLVYRDGRYWCGEVLISKPKRAEQLKKLLFIGAGCCANLNSDRAKYAAKAAAKKDKGSESDGE